MRYSRPGRLSPRATHDPRSVLSPAAQKCVSRMADTCVSGAGACLRLQRAVGRHVDTAWGYYSHFPGKGFLRRKEEEESWPWVRGKVRILPQGIHT